MSYEHVSLRQVNEMMKGLVLSTN